MKKRIITLVLIILAVIAVFTGILYVIRMNNQNGFPHYKQAIIPLQGTIYGMPKQEVKLPLTFVDEIEMSEMASSENIKSINLTTCDNVVIPAKTWSVTKRNSSEKYVLRNLDVVLELDSFKEQKTSLKTVDIKFNDGLSKTFEIGSVWVEQHSAEDFQKNYGTIDVQSNYPTASDGNLPTVTGAVVNIFTYGKNIKVNNIDFGIDGLGIDKSSVKTIDKEMDFNEFEEARASGKDFTKAFLSAKAVKNLDKFQSLDIKAGKEINSGSTILLSFEYTEKFKVRDSVNIYSVKVEYTDLQTGEDKYVLEQTPYYQLPIGGSDFSGENFLKENGK